MAIEIRPVYSSSISELAHNDETNELHVTWKDGKTSVYSGVSKEKFERAATAWSVGKYIHAQIKPFHEHRYA